MRNYRIQKDQAGVQTQEDEDQSGAKTCPLCSTVVLMQKEGGLNSHYPVWDFVVTGSLSEGRCYFTENTVDFLKLKFDCI